MMNTLRITSSLLVLSAAIAQQTLAAEPDANIRASVETYVNAFNAADAEAVAACWSERGVWVTPSGQRIVGQTAIRSAMQAYFAEGKAPRIQIENLRIRQIAPTVAIEEGRARVMRRSELPEESTYIAIHVKEEAGWRIESVRETRVPQKASNFNHLKDLDWMIGTWVDEGNGSTITTKCQWTKNRNFLTRSFGVNIAGKLTLEGTQVVGWDPIRKQIRSWVFDSDGGFAEGIWSRDGDRRWIVKSLHTTGDGLRASSINIITKVDDERFQWESTGREIDGELQPSIEPVMVRRAQPDTQ